MGVQVQGEKKEEKEQKTDLYGVLQISEALPTSWVLVLEENYH